MVSERSHHDPASNRATPDASGRLNLLVSYGGWRDLSWADQLPRLLEPMGIVTFRVESGVEAADLIESAPVHIAVVDLNLPLDRREARTAAVTHTGGARILQLLRRLEDPPPTVVVRRPVDKAAANQRTLHQALREGAFSVLDAPVALEQILGIMRRILQRHYADRWPSEWSGGHP
ncbi:MAG: hypothetical protein ACF8PN_10440 [Phycisphaerales bacterium]